MEYEIILQYLRPELFILVFVLYLLGMPLKKSQYIKDEFIPVILGLISIALCAIYILSVSTQPTDYQQVLSLVFDILVQGVLCAAGSVYVNQIYKQYVKLMSTNIEEDKDDDSNK